MKYKIAASILSADFGKLSQEIKTVEQYGIDMIHVDVMDGHFVPNITIGPQVVKSLRKNTNSILDTHLMIENPEKYIKAFADAGSDIITFHYECGCNIEETIKLIKSFNKKVGISINPDTPLEKISKYIFDLDMILLMTVFPGFAGQGFEENVLSKIKELRKIIADKDKNEDIDIQVDGGINDVTIGAAVEAGANIFVSGNYIFNSEDVEGQIKSLQQKIDK